MRIFKAAPLVLIVVLSFPADALARQTEDPEDLWKRPGRDRPCDTLEEEERRRTERCKTDEERRIDEQNARRAAAMQREKPEHSWFLKWLHADALWLPGRAGADVFGLVGFHLAVARIGRVHLFGPPGLMVLLHDTNEGRRVRPAFTWGLGYSLTEMHVPFKQEPMQLFLNVAEARVTGGGNLTMVGLSVTWRK